MWHENRPSYSKAPVLVHKNEFAGRDVKDKLEWLRVEMKKKAVDFLLICALDEIAWLYNIRGSDIPCISPFPLPTLLLTRFLSFR